MGSKQRAKPRTVSSCAAVLAIVAGPSCMAANANVKIESFAVPTSNAGVYSVAAADNGDVWFVESAAEKLGKIAPSGVISEYPLSSDAGAGNPIAIGKGPDQRIWFTTDASKVGAISATGTIAYFAARTAIDFFPSPIVSGSDSRLYFFEQKTKLGAISTSGVASDYSVPTVNPALSGIAAGPDGNIWFTEFNGNKIGRMTVSGEVVEFALPVARSQPSAITSGPDGNLWFVENRCPNCETDATNAIEVIGRITPAGAITEFQLPSTKGKSSFGTPQAIVTGSDGALWFTESVNNLVGRISTSGIVSEFELPTADDATPRAMAVSKDGSLWVASSGSARDYLYRLTINSTPSLANGVTGSWYDPNQSGQGFSLEVLPDNILVAYWYTFTPSGEATWITASGTFSGNSANLDGYQIVGSGAKFPPYFDAKNVHAQLWGTLTFTFSDCTGGKVDWTAALPGYGAGTMNLKRLTQPQDTSCP